MTFEQWWAEQEPQMVRLYNSQDLELIKLTCHLAYIAGRAKHVDEMLVLIKE